MRPMRQTCPWRAPMPPPTSMLCSWRRPRRTVISSMPSGTRTVVSGGRRRPSWAWSRSPIASRPAWSAVSVRRGGGEGRPRRGAGSLLRAAETDVNPPRVDAELAAGEGGDGVHQQECVVGVDDARYLLQGLGDAGAGLAVDDGDHLGARGGLP